MIAEWHLWLLASLAAVHALVSYLAYRRVRPGVGDAGVATDGSTDRIDGDAAVVDCPECGTENELGYRYCRSCVGRLPGAVDFGRRTDSPLRRTTR